jgi:hypothetical protein
MGIPCLRVGACLDYPDLSLYPSPPGWLAPRPSHSRSRGQWPRP